MKCPFSPGRIHALTKPTPIPACNPLCGKCRRQCKQPPAAVLVDCPRFLPFPFKVAKHRFDQLDLFKDKS
jgi:hypothetical protein